MLYSQEKDVKLSAIFLQCSYICESWTIMLAGLVLLSVLVLSPVSNEITLGHVPYLNWSTSHVTYQTICMSIIHTHTHTHTDTDTRTSSCVCVRVCVYLYKYMCYTLKCFFWGRITKWPRKHATFV